MTATIPVGFVPLIDAGLLIVAVEMGFDRAEGITLDLRRANSWSALRDMVSFGQVTAAQMLSPGRGRCGAGGRCGPVNERRGGVRQRGHGQKVARGRS
mgnify:CR=1 FL=1